MGAGRPGCRRRSRVALTQLLFSDSVTLGHSFNPPRVDSSSPVTQGDYCDSSYTQRAAATTRKSWGAAFPSPVSLRQRGPIWRDSGGRPTLPLPPLPPPVLLESLHSLFKTGCVPHRVARFSKQEDRLLELNLISEKTFWAGVSISRIIFGIS